MLKHKTHTGSADCTSGDDEEHWQCGQTCLYCDKDLSCSPDGDDHGTDEDDEFNEYKYRIEFTPQLLPAVDFL
nr:hypothetical protein [Tanacetum cinerariifolium]